MHWRLATALVLSGATLNGCSCTPPTPTLHVSPGNTVEVGQTVTFDSNPQDGDMPDHVVSDNQLDWDLDGDGSFGERPGERVVRTSFAAPGKYSVTFHVVGVYTESVLGESELPVHGYATQVVTVVAKLPPSQNQPPTADLQFNPDPAITEYAGTYDASASTDPDGQIVKYEWQWGDGTPDTTSTSPSVKHAYEFAGTYGVHLITTDDKGATGTTDRTVQVQDGPPPGKVIAREAAAVTAAGAGSPFTIALDHATLSPGTTTVSGAKLVTAGFRARGRLHFKKEPKLLGRQRSPRWAGSIALVQRGSGTTAKLAGQGYILLALSKRNSVCLAGTASATLVGRGFKGRLAVAGGKGPGARLRGTGSFAPPVGLAAGKPRLSGHLKLRKVRKARPLPRACRTLARSLR
jgi:PKD repeat protein